MNHPTPNLLLLALLINSILFPFLTNAYRIGDAVGILLKTHTPSNGSATLEAYRHQLPRFGVSSKTRFDVSSLLNADDIRLSEGGTSQNNKPHRQHRTNDASPPNEEHLRLSLSFDEGFHHIPWLDVYNPSTSRYNNDHKVLQNLIITIVYSGSDGSIHAVHRETRYQDAPLTKKGRDDKGNDNGSGMPKSFTVEYIWVNEADVDVQGGLLVMFVVVLIVSLSSMVGACTSSGDDSGSQTTGGMKGKRLKEKHSSSSLGVGSGGGFAKRL